MLEEKLQPKEVNYTHENIENNLIPTKSKEEKSTHTSSSLQPPPTTTQSPLVIDMSQYQWSQFSAKRHSLTKWLQKQDPSFSCIQKHTPASMVDTTSG